MRANPGGQLSPDEVVGRDKLIAKLWDILERQSVVLTSERRIGKTQVVKKMEAEVSEIIFAVYRDLEDLHTALQFAEVVSEDVEAYLSLKARVATRVRQFLRQLTGLEVGGVLKFPKTAALHWKTLLKKAIEDLVEHQDRPLIFFWDELPAMLLNIKNQEGEVAAMELLDVLRHLRQTHGSLRMVFTGSIGLHNVISSLRAAGYASDPTNDMKTINLQPLSSSDAEALTLNLLQGEDIQAENLIETAHSIAVAVDNVPYYIHHVVLDLSFFEGTVDATVVEKIVASRLTDPQDEWHMEHYRERIDTYYASEQQHLALALLDMLAAGKPLAFDDLFNQIQLSIGDVETEVVRGMLKLLLRDHYLEFDMDRTYRFRFPLIRRWWQLHRG